MSVFTLRAARSGGFVAVLGVAIFIETADFHLVLSMASRSVGTSRSSRPAAFAQP